MFGIGFIELCVIGLFAVIFVGPKKLPEMMKQFGKFFVHARRMTSEVKQTFDQVIRDAEQEMHMDDLKKIRELTSIDIDQARQEILKSAGLYDHGKPAPEGHDPHYHHGTDHDHDHDGEPSFDKALVLPSEADLPTASVSEVGKGGIQEDHHKADHDKGTKS
jgi:Tat protein translocase TatB subunit